MKKKTKICLYCPLQTESIHIHINQMEKQRIIPPEPSEQLLTVNYESKRDSALSLQKDYFKMCLTSRAVKLQKGRKSYIVQNYAS